MRKSACLAMGLAFLLACEKNEETSIQDSNNQGTHVEEPKIGPIPLEVGNQWVYEYGKINYDSSGNVISTSVTGVDTVTILKDTLIEDQVFYKTKGSLASYFSNTSAFNTYINNKEGTLQRYFENTQTIKPLTISIDTINGVADKLIDDTYKTTYHIHKSNENYLFQGKALTNLYKIQGENYRKRNNVFERNECADPNQLLDPAVGVVYEEAFFSSCNGAKNGLYKKLIRFTSP